MALENNRIIKIDPTAITAADTAKQHSHAYLLNLFLKQQEMKINKPSLFRRLFAWFIGKKVKTFEHGKEHTVYVPNVNKPNKATPIKFTLTHDITYAPIKVKAAGKKIAAYAINDPETKPLGEGVYGKVTELAGVMIRKSGDLTFKNKKHYIDKIQEHSLLNTTNAAKREANILKKTHAEARHAVIEKNSLFHQRSHIIDEKFGENNLTEIMNNPNKYPLCDEKKLLISINFLRKVQEIHAHGYIHHDLWPDNVLVDTKSCEVRTIDYGSSKLKTAWIQNGGKKINAAPEKFSIIFNFEKVNERSDIYAAGLVLARLWFGVKRDSFSLVGSFVATIKQYFNLIFIRKESFIMPTKDKLPDKTSQSMLDVVNGMLRLNPSDRPQLSDITHTIEKIRIADSQPNNEKIKKVCDIACVTRNELIQLGSKKPTLFGPKEKCDKHLEILSLLKTSLENGIQQLGDSPEELSEFITITGIKRAFCQLKNKKELLEATHTIIDQYKQHSYHLRTVHDQLAGKITILLRDPEMRTSNHLDFLKDQLNDIYYIMQKIESSRTHLDDLVKINKHCEKKLARIETKVAEAEDCYHFRNSTSQYKIYSKLVITNQTDDLNTLRNKARKTIIDFLLQTPQLFATHLSNRVIAEKQVSDMNRLLTTIDNPKVNDIGTLKNLIKLSFFDIEPNNPLKEKLEQMMAPAGGMSP